MKTIIAILIVIIISSCQTSGKYFNRPKVNQCIALAEPGLMACAGVVHNIPAGLVIAKTFNDYESIRKYYADKEQRLMVCLKHRKRCK